MDSNKLNSNSFNEQRLSGLRNLSPYLEKRLFISNQAYIAKFGFPFICVVRGLTVEYILIEFEKSLMNNFETEFIISKNKLEKSAYLRLKDLINEKNHPETERFNFQNLNNSIYSCTQ
jgi:2-oxo-4-hydroxy-4-carboxy--5-ureidoimidazoline (OHCU) decarboxylase